MFGGYPEEVPEEYQIRSSILFTDQIDCPLLLIHGEMDDVVPVRHTLRLAQALKDRQTHFELHLFPDEGHIWSMDGFNHNWELTLEFFERHLKQPL